MAGISPCSRNSMALQQQASEPQLLLLALTRSTYLLGRSPLLCFERVEMVFHADDPRTTHTFWLPHFAERTRGKSSLIVGLRACPFGQFHARVLLTRCFASSAQGDSSSQHRPSPFFHCKRWRANERPRRQSSLRSTGQRLPGKNSDSLIQSHHGDPSAHS